jgi:hypothetical protein
MEVIGGLIIGILTVLIPYFRLQSEIKKLKTETGNVENEGLIRLTLFYKKEIVELISLITKLKDEINSLRITLNETACKNSECKNRSLY